MSRNLMRLLACLQTLCLWPLVLGSPVYLFGVTPNKDMVAVSIDSEREGRSQAISLPMRLSPLLGEVKMMSYDETSHSLLVESYDGRVQQSALCHTRLAYHRSLLNTSRLVYLEEGGGSVCWNCKVTNYALYNTNLYFVLHGIFNDKTETQTKKVQLRVMQSCSACNLTQSINDFATFEMFRAPFLFNCSKLIAEIYNSGVTGEENIKIKSGHSLKIVKQDGYLSFFFQIFYGKNSQSNHFVDLDLYHVTERGTVELLHREKIHRRFANWKINGVGGVDYNAGLLCWTSGDRIYCGDFMDQQLSNTKMVLYPGDSVTSDVCKGNRPNLLPIVTGISILNVTDRQSSLVFGCYTQWPSLGGAGLITINKQMTSKHVFPVYIGRQRLKLGSLFTTAEVISECQSIGDVAMCENPRDFPKDARYEVITMKNKIKDKNRTKTTTPGISFKEAPYRMNATPNDTVIIPISYNVEVETIIQSNSGINIAVYLRVHNLLITFFMLASVIIR